MSEHPWFALRTKPRHEKAVAAALENQDYTAFLPLHRTSRVWASRSKLQEVELPLFPGYLFCRFDPLRRLPILTTPGVLAIVGIGKAPAAVPDEEIAALGTALKSGVHLEPWPFVELGQRVRVDRGALEGLEGILTEIKSNARLIISVTLLKRSVSLEIDRSWVRPLGRVGAPVCLDPNTLPLSARRIA